GRQTPSKLRIGAKSAPVPRFVCTTGSFTWNGCVAGLRDSFSRGTICVTGATGRTGRSLTAGDSPSKTPSPTFGPNEATLLCAFRCACWTRPVPPARAIPTLRSDDLTAEPAPATSAATTDAIRSEPPAASLHRSDLRCISLHPRVAGLHRARTVPRRGAYT